MTSPAVDYTPPALRPTPRAWLGYATPTIVRVCSRCPDRKRAEAEAEQAGQSVSHGLCTQCAFESFNECLALDSRSEAYARQCAQGLYNSTAQPVHVYRLRNGSHWLAWHQYDFMTLVHTYDMPGTAQ